MASANWYGVDGERVVGPFRSFSHTKQALSISLNTHNDQKLESNLYRYGYKFIGEHDRLVKNNIMTPRRRHDNNPRITHVRLTYGRRGDDDLDDLPRHIRTVGQDEWQDIS